MILRRRRQLLSHLSGALFERSRIIGLTSRTSWKAVLDKASAWPSHNEWCHARTAILKQQQDTMHKLRATADVLLHYQAWTAFA